MLTLHVMSEAKKGATAFRTAASNIYKALSASTAASRRRQFAPGAVGFVARSLGPVTKMLAKLSVHPPRRAAAGNSLPVRLVSFPVHLAR